jgi:polysaccharide pyruvyl transferase WcaK-like protein/SAM-dependent methyltransferase
MAWANAFARLHGLREQTTWSKVWEYPWSWRQLARLEIPRLTMLDIGSELSPMPWLFAALGARVTLIETEGAHAAHWRELRETLGFDVEWQIVEGPRLPFAAGAFDVVTSYSVIEHIPDKETAIDEAVRVLRPGGTLCLTFDVCEPARGMTFPEWNGCALDMAAFDRLVWKRADLEPVAPSAAWNVEDIDEFLAWHRTTAPHHNYVVGGAVFARRHPRRALRSAAAGALWSVHQLDTGIGSGNAGDDAMLLGLHQALPPGLALTAEVHASERARALLPDLACVDRADAAAVEASIRAADFALLAGDTPIMDAWGIDWPLAANAVKLDLCRRLGKPVHAAGVGVDRLVDPEAIRIFHSSYSGIASWSVRSDECRAALLELGVPPERVIVGADWAWLLEPALDRAWAEAHLAEQGLAPGRTRIGVNLVNERWRDRRDLKRAWAELLDQLAERHDADVVFLCNESRAGEYFDRAAAEEVRAAMRRPAWLVAGRHYDPAEMIALLASMTVAISQRYHFTLFAVLAGVYPVTIRRGQKVAGLMRELGLPFVGDMERVDAPAVASAVATALRGAEAELAGLASCRRHLAARAANNLALLRFALARGAVA